MSTEDSLGSPGVLVRMPFDVSKLTPEQKNDTAMAGIYGNDAVEALYASSSPTVTVRAPTPAPSATL